MNTKIPLVPIAHWHIPLHWTYRELSLVFFGREGKKVTLQDIDTLLLFLHAIRPGFVKELLPDYEI